MMSLNTKLRARLGQLLVLSLFAFGISTPASAGLPELKWSAGDHAVKLSMVHRVRYENWDAHSHHADGFWGFRTRIGARYDWKDKVGIFAEFQDARVYGVSRHNTSGAGPLYMGTSTSSNSVASQRLRNLYVDVRPGEGVLLRAGRQDIKLGTQVKYAEGNWNYVKFKRLSQRLLGTVGWTNGERAYDGLTAMYDQEGHNIYGLYARPTTGVFDIENAYKQQSDIAISGVSWTVKRNAWLENTELRFFALDFDDHRSVADGGLDSNADGSSDDIDILTVGGQLVGIYPFGPGNVDVALWLAYQQGDYGTLDHQAWAGIAEFGYQFTDVPWTPWVRIGMNAASGDPSGSDGDHDTFFNLLPTNHLYYGFADRYAFQNLINYFVQLRLKPCKNVGVDLFVHHFEAAEKADTRYFGSGAFKRSATGGLGFGGQASSAGHDTYGTEIDLVITAKINKHISLAGGYSYMFGHEAFQGMSDDDVRFGFVQAVFKY